MNPYGFSTTHLSNGNYTLQFLDSYGIQHTRPATAQEVQLVKLLNVTYDNLLDVKADLKDAS